MKSIAAALFLICAPLAALAQEAAPPSGKAASPDIVIMGQRTPRTDSVCAEGSRWGAAGLGVYLSDVHYVYVRSRQNFFVIGQKIEWAARYKGADVLRVDGRYVKAEPGGEFFACRDRLTAKGRILPNTPPICVPLHGPKDIDQLDGPPHGSSCAKPAEAH